MRVFTNRAYSNSTTGTAANISSIEAEEYRELARECRVEANRAGIDPEVKASLLEEADTYDRWARERNSRKLGNHRIPKW